MWSLIHQASGRGSPVFSKCGRYQGITAETTVAPMKSVAVALIPAMTRPVIVVVGAVIGMVVFAARQKFHVLFVTKPVEVAAAKSASDRDMAEGAIERFQNFFAQHFLPAAIAVVRIIGHIRHAVMVGDLAIEHFAHKKVFGEPNTAQFGQFGDRLTV